MTKLLTVSVAAYNVEATLPQALDSIVDAGVLPRVQVVVVDDGSTDATAVIARSYADKYPESFALVSKSNGGYGSTINTSLPLAMGAYYRLLDGDDWFDPVELSRLTGMLETAHDDLILTTEYREVYEGGGECVRRLPISVGAGKGFNSLSGLLSLGHHQTVFRTAALRGGGFAPLLEHCYYTDEQFMLQGLIKAETITVVEGCPYCYRLGFAGQSVSVNGYARHYREGVRCHQAMCATLRQYACVDEKKTWFLRRYLANSLQNLYGMFLCLPPSKENRQQLVAYHRYMLRENPDIYAVARARKVLLLRYSRFLFYRPLAWRWKRKLSSHG